MDRFLTVLSMVPIAFGFFFVQAAGLRGKEGLMGCEFGRRLLATRWTFRRRLCVQEKDRLPLSAVWPYGERAR
ncbi:MAG: hypothetical protein A3J27_05395 [Candidatus Tectomicrobia bacterium RIFCSPLOWO2_12_FULL_69_37]|nr:MAG: hypothetical protein A3J27_05395 [Candidatus Tectomicrobia bacterium RIFCSPLOWO2_12_FULL_69_37]